MQENLAIKIKNGFSLLTVPFDLQFSIVLSSTLRTLNCRDKNFITLLLCFSILCFTNAILYFKHLVMFPIRTFFHY